MKSELTVDEIGKVLRLGHFWPYFEEVDWLKIEKEGDEFHVYVGELPEVFVEKRVPTSWFEFKEEEYLLYLAMDMVNAKMSRAKVFFVDTQYTLVFRVGISPETPKKFLDGLEHCVSAIERAISEMGRACSLMVERSEKFEAEEMMEKLQDTSPDNPWLNSKIVS
jgi:hypothetical protein